RQTSALLVRTWHASNDMIALGYVLCRDLQGTEDRGDGYEGDGDNPLFTCHHPPVPGRAPGSSGGIPGDPRAPQRRRGESQVHLVRALRPRVPGAEIGRASCRERVSVPDGAELV